MLAAGGVEVWLMHCRSLKPGVACKALGTRQTDVVRSIYRCVSLPYLARPAVYMFCLRKFLLSLIGDQLSQDLLDRLSQFSYEIVGI